MNAAIAGRGGGGGGGGGGRGCGGLDVSHPDVALDSARVYGARWLCRCSTKGCSKRLRGWQGRRCAGLRQASPARPWSYGMLPGRPWWGRGVQVLVARPAAAPWPDALLRWPSPACKQVHGWHSPRAAHASSRILLGMRCKLRCSTMSSPTPSEQLAHEHRRTQRYAPISPRPRRHRESHHHR